MTNYSGVQDIDEQMAQEAGLLQRLMAEIRKVIVGQDDLIQRLLIGVLADGHILLEGVPGLAKTLLVKTLAEAIQADFSRIQFTPDLLSADLLGTQFSNPQPAGFGGHRRPIFATLTPSDEMNQARAQVQTAPPRRTASRQVTIGDETYPLGNLFLVLATQNPVEQEGTYPLPEAQVDRFMLKVLVDYPSRDEERLIMDRMTGGPTDPVMPVIDRESILQVRETVRGIYVDDKVKDYVLDIVIATRKP